MGGCVEEGRYSGGGDGNQLRGAVERWGGVDQVCQAVEQLPLVRPHGLAAGQQCDALSACRRACRQEPGVGRDEEPRIQPNYA
jgi:hypothetical protein